MKRFLRRQLRAIAARLGYELHPLGPIDLREKTANPIEASYLAGRRQFVIEVPLASCCGLHGFPFSRLHPFVRTVCDYREGRACSFETSCLARYYEMFQPKHAGDLLGVTSASSPLRKIPPLAFCWPWDPRPPEQLSQLNLRRTGLENRRRGGANLSASHGFAGHGPVSEQKGRIEFANLIRLARSIEHNGYVRSNLPDGDIRVFPLIKSRSEVKYFVKGGQHRSAVLAALGYVCMPVLVLRPLRLDDVPYWPMVRAGLMAEDEAVALFERLFSGTPPARAIPPEWLSEASARRV
jgi:hypothetical protein